MALTIFVLLFFYLPLVKMLNFEQPVAEKVWSERCSKHDISLNDCNWCTCTPKNDYTCNARSCREVDMFGHFNDAINAMDVGMEGHSVWRSGSTICEPGVNYQKKDLLCICTEDGKWPNPVCRDTFQILHTVEVTHHKEPQHNQTCTAKKLYLFDCNVCICTANGTIDPAYCTKRDCENEVLNKTDQALETAEEIYATCTPTKRYNLGCQSCVCLRNNRLLCNNCTSSKSSSVQGKSSICEGKQPHHLFENDCNYCHCDSKGTVYCTTKKCIAKHTAMTLPDTKFNSVGRTPDDYNCVPGSTYEKDCNTCHCFLLDGIKYFACTVNSCKGSDEWKTRSDCVADTSYKANCLVCHCVVDDDDVKREFCTADDTCKLDENRALQSPSDNALLHGYCEPLHFYQIDCNKCRCMADGKTLACTSKLCPKLTSSNLPSERDGIANASDDKSLVTEFIPFRQKDNFCPKGHTYMIDCNICYCLDTGNAICTTKDCKV